MAEGNQGQLASRLADVLTGSYEIEGEIGRGGMGIVFSARDVKLKRRVAIKVLPPELAFREEIRKRFTREAQTAARLSHPHIVPIHTVGEEEGLVYFVMGFVDGESLAARLRRRERLPVEETRRIMKETADALGLAHAMSVIHRDIKPDNILLEGTRRRVMVTDFGIAKALSDIGSGTLTGTGVAIGTPAYMSPEQAAGDREIDATSDIYSLGVVAYEMLTGEVPFKAPTVAGILLKQVTQPVPDIMTTREDCPEELAVTVMRCLDKEPENRWPTADALRRALESRTSAPYRPRSPLSRRPQPSRRGTGRPAAARPPARKRDAEWWDWFEQGDRKPDRTKHRGVQHRRERDRKGKDVQAPETEPGVVRRFRSNFASYVSVNGGLLLLNVYTGLGEPWFLVPSVLWGIGLASQYGKLWTAGYSMRDVLNRPPAADALPAPNAGARANPSRQLPEPTSGEFGRYAGQLEQMRRDHTAILRLVDRLPESERHMLPDVVPTVDSLVQRANDLARMLQHMEGSVDDGAVAGIEARIQALESESDGPERTRRIELLRRQRESLDELSGRRVKVEAQLESCVLAVQNVRFDLLRLRSAGVQEVLSDLTSATQAARAMQIDVEAALDAAGEIRDALGRGKP
jgi:serine/threonine-protein kinase